MSSRKFIHHETTRFETVRQPGALVDAMAALLCLALLAAAACAAYVIMGGAL
jgi:hypothetical protein